MYPTEEFAKKNVLNQLSKHWFPIAFLISSSTSILLLMVLDYLNMESFYVFNQRFLFIATWKGRMFYLFFAWLLLLELIIDWEKVVEETPKKRFRIFATFAFTIIPLIYVLGVNFWGLNNLINGLGQNFGFKDFSLQFHWPLTAEYLVFALSFLAATFLAYTKKGLNFFSIALSLLLGMTIIYAIDTFYPGGTFRPFELLAFPTATCAATILSFLGYQFLYIPEIFHPEYGSAPMIDGALIGWPCAGVHSLLLYTVIILLIFKRSNISRLRKIIYFVIGAFGTFFVNVLRIVSYFVILWNDGRQAADFFHNNIGELYFIVWISAYIIMIIAIQRFQLVEKARYTMQNLLTSFGRREKQSSI